MNNLNNQDSINYGIIYTPNNLVNNILDLISEKYFKDPNLKWLDIGAGNGAFSLNIFNRLNNNLSNKEHIIENMLYMVEIYPDHIKELNNLFTINANIIEQDFLALDNNYSKFDFIVGNPPYNINGKLKTPTNSNIKKTDDGKQVYVEFIKKSLSLLKPNGFLSCIIPSLWLKPDKAGLYNILTNKKIIKLVCLSTSQTQKAFNYKAQTPTCYFLIQNTDVTNKNINIYDDLNEKFINYNLKPEFPIPINGINIINKLLNFTDIYSSLKVYKSSTTSKNSIFNNDFGEKSIHINIKTTVLSNNNPTLVINYSNIAQQYNNEPKLIMAHKMYGFPYYDISGIYGISSRDNYIILEKDYNKNDLLQIQAFLSTKTALFLFSTTNYRMRYLERYAFEFIPNITKIENFPNLLNVSREKRDNLIYSFFNFSQNEKIKIEKFHKNYNFFI
jgi:2-polyprenyl-3-methyl-5-hydroxy-6-metoxy-1,4-benzoquinol methylase